MVDALSSENRRIGPNSAPFPTHYRHSGALQWVKLGFGMSEMYDPQYQQFRGRLARLDRMHRRGQGFEAPGTLGRSYYTRATSRRIPLWRSLGVMAMAVLVIKALILAQIGALDYNERLARASGDSWVQQTAVYIMQIDPITEWMATEMRKLAGFLA